jgi:hypothetical protein
MADFALADDFLPIYDVSDAVATVADADRDTAWRALVDVDLKLDREAPVAGMGASPAWTACPSASSSGAPHTLPPNVRVGRPFGGHCETRAGRPLPRHLAATNPRAVCGRRKAGGEESAAAAAAASVR